MSATSLDSETRSRGRTQAAGVALLLLALGGVAAMATFWGAARVGAALVRGLPALPFALGVHAMQLAITGTGWWCLLPSPRPRPARAIKARFIREAVNTILPLGGLSGAVAATRVLARETGLPISVATATVTADLTCEATALAIFLAASLATVAILAPGSLSAGRAAIAVVPIAAGALGFVLAQRAGAMRLLEAAARRFGFGAAMEGLHDSLMALHAGRDRVLRAVALQTLAWALGGAEVWIVLMAIGHPISPAAAFAMEGFGMAGRGLGFALPSGLAAQEAGFVLAGSLLGVPAPEAIALSMVKRVRELIVALAGSVVWQWGRIRKLG